MRAKKKQTHKWTYQSSVIKFQENLYLKMDSFQLTAKALSRLTDIEQKNIKKYLSGRLLPTPEEFDKLDVVLKFTGLQKADYNYQYNKYKTTKDTAKK